MSALTSKGEARTTFEARTPASAELHARACRVMPGGNTRTCAHYDPYPLALVRGEGPHVWDADGNRYVDLCSNGLALIHGQAFGPVVAALDDAARRGTAWGGPTESQVRLAELLCERLPSAEAVRFCSSGTEAGILAAKLARRATGRPLLLKAWLGYHGGYDDLEAGLHGNGELPGRVRLARWGDAEDFERVLRDDDDRIAAVVVEPATVTGAVPAPPEFLSRLRAATRAAGALLVLDECITFRSDVGGLQAVAGVQPDLTMLGKFIGGGLALGAVAGDREVLAELDPTRSSCLYHSGSYNGNWLASASAVATLEHLGADAFAAMNERAAALAATLGSAIKASDAPLQVTCVGSMLGFHLGGAAPDLADDAHQRRAREIFHLAALNAGVLLVPVDGVCGLSTAINDAVLADAGERLVQAVSDCAEELRQLAESMRAPSVA